MSADKSNKCEAAPDAEPIRYVYRIPCRGDRLERVPVYSESDAELLVHLWGRRLWAGKEAFRDTPLAAVNEGLCRAQDGLKHARYRLEKLNKEQQRAAENVARDEQRVAHLETLKRTAEEA